MKLKDWGEEERKPERRKHNRLGKKPEPDDGFEEDMDLEPASAFEADADLDSARSLRGDYDTEPDFDWEDEDDYPFIDTRRHGSKPADQQADSGVPGDFGADMDSNLSPEDEEEMEPGDGRSDGRRNRHGRRAAKGDMDGWEEEDGEEELPPLKLWEKVLIFLGLAVLAAVICAVLWRFVRPERQDGSGQEISTDAVEPDAEPEQAQKPHLELSPEPDTEQAGESASGVMLDLPPETDAAGGIVDESAPEPGTEAAVQTPSDTEGADREPVDGTADMKFEAVEEIVMPKDVVNLRSVPTTTNADNIAVQIQNGETFTRIGINKDTGWSKVVYQERTLYAVTQYLTTDLDYKPPVKPSDPNRVSTLSGRIIIFKDCDDWITPKEYVNLRKEPSTTEGEATISCQLNNGEKAHRTGYSTDAGWSRVEYDGQVLYVVTSLIYEVPAE